MPVLPSWGTHRVYGSWGSLVNPGQLLPGTVSAILPVDVHNVPQDIIIPKGRHINAQALNTTAGLPSLDIEVPASDDPDNLPTDFYIEIVVQLTEPRVTYTYRIPTPLGGETNLRTILDPTSVTVDGPLFVGVPGGLAQLSSDGLSVLNADGDPISTGGGGTTLTSYDQVSSLADYPATFPAETHQHTAAQISDATAVGRSVLQASSMTAARDAIGAGTSSLQLGTGSTTAAAGDHAHTQYATTTALTTHTGSTANPHSVTKSQVGLSNVDDTSDANKPISTAAQGALDTKANLSSGHVPLGEATAGLRVTVLYNAGWPTRPTARTDIYVDWLDLTGGSLDANGDLVDTPTGAITGDLVTAKRPEA